MVNLLFTTSGGHKGGTSVRTGRRRRSRDIVVAVVNLLVLAFGGGDKNNDHHHLSSSSPFPFRFIRMIQALQPVPPSSPPQFPTMVQDTAVYRAPLRQQQQQQQQQRRQQKKKKTETTAEVETVPAVPSSSVSVAFSDASPYCFAVSSILDLPVQANFLATQVWPAARVAATTLEDCLVRRNPPPWLCRTTNTTSTSTLTPSTTTATHRNTTPFTICELGCGPGLPSLTAAAVVAAATEASDLTTNIRVIATDVDDFALELVQAAAKEQGLDRIVTTHRFDLVHHDDRRENDNTHTTTTKQHDTNTASAAAVGWLDEVDLFVMSDVFESTTVAKGAAKFTHRILTDGKQRRIWVFAQTDRVQREVYVQELQMLFAAAATTATATLDTTATATLQWLPVESYDIENDRLWLCDVDETLVNYG